jgi:hypothetical protein
MEVVQLLSCLLAIIMVGKEADGLDRERWSTLAHHERDIERVAARRILQEEEEQQQHEAATHVRQERKVGENAAAEKIEGRFFLQDKLCALGLTEVRSCS